VLGTRAIENADRFRTSIIDKTTFWASGVEGGGEGGASASPKA